MEGRRRVLGVVVRSHPTGWPGVIGVAVAAGLFAAFLVTTTAAFWASTQSIQFPWWSFAIPGGVVGLAVAISFIWRYWRGGETLEGLEQSLRKLGDKSRDTWL
jgi:H+/Cl- antiporter ClcA